MIIINIHSGLGNQLFQYAFARNLSLKLNQNLKLDLSQIFIQEKMHSKSMYRLDKFNTIQEHATSREIDQFRGYESQFLLSRLVKRVTKIRLYKNGKYYFDEYKFHKFQNKINRKDDFYLLGYWGDPIYFEENYFNFKKDFTLTAPLDLAILEYKKK